MWSVSALPSLFFLLLFTPSDGKVYVRDEKARAKTEGKVARDDEKATFKKERAGASSVTAADKAVQKADTWGILVTKRCTSVIATGGGYIVAGYNGSVACLDKYM